MRHSKIIVSVIRMMNSPLPCRSQPVNYRGETRKRIFAEVVRRSAPRERDPRIRKTSPASPSIHVVHGGVHVLSSSENTTRAFTYFRPSARTTDVVVGPIRRKPYVKTGQPVGSKVHGGERSWLARWLAWLARSFAWSSEKGATTTVARGGAGRVRKSRWRRSAQERRWRARRGGGEKKQEGICLLTIKRSLRSPRKRAARRAVNSCASEY